MNENEIIQLAARRINDLVGIKAAFKAGDLNPTNGEIDFTYKGKTIKAFVAIKKDLRPYHLPEILEIFKYRRPLIIVADRIYPALKQELRENGIGYLDTAGNIYVEQNETFFLLEGNKQTENIKQVTNRAFTKTGLKTVFYLLLHNEAINLPYRKLAETTEVALGNIKNIIEGLREAGFILHLDEKNLHLQNKKALLDRWIAGYRETLKPALHIGTFKFFTDEEMGNLENLQDQKGEIIWGGEPAAEGMTNYLRPEIYTMYTTMPKVEIMQKVRLIPDPKGNVEVYKKFWKNDITDNIYAPPLLVYADLVITDDPRNLETAEMIFYKYLRDEFN